MKHWYGLGSAYPPHSNWPIFPRLRSTMTSAVSSTPRRSPKITAKASPPGRAIFQRLGGVRILIYHPLLFPILSHLNQNSRYHSEDLVARHRKVIIEMFELLFDSIGLVRVMICCGDRRVCVGVVRREGRLQSVVEEGLILLSSYIPFSSPLMFLSFYRLGKYTILIRSAFLKSISRQEMLFILTRM